MLYEKFGEFDSAEEINVAADGQKAEGDTDAIFAIAQENGLDREDAQDFIGRRNAGVVLYVVGGAGKAESGVH